MSNVIPKISDTLGAWKADMVPSQTKNSSHFSTANKNVIDLKTVPNMQHSIF